MGAPFWSVTFPAICVWECATVAKITARIVITLFIDWFCLYKYLSDAKALKILLTQFSDFSDEFSIGKGMILSCKPRQITYSGTAK